MDMKEFCFADYCGVCTGFPGHWRVSLYRRLPGGRPQVVWFHGEMSQRLSSEEVSNELTMLISYRPP